MYNLDMREKMMVILLIYSIYKKLQTFNIYELNKKNDVITFQYFRT